jgi:hypothetical protein
VDAGTEVIFKQDKAVIKKCGSGQEIASAPRIGNLYVYNQAYDRFIGTVENIHDHLFSLYFVSCLLFSNVVFHS